MIEMGRIGIKGNGNDEEIIDLLEKVK